MHAIAVDMTVTERGSGEPKMAEQLERIGVIKTNGHLANISYVGGSTFRIDFGNQAPGTKAPTVKQETIDKWVKAGKCKLTSPDRYAQIVASIDPQTGETKTHHADGTPKTLIEQELTQLRTEGFVASDETGGTSPQRPRPSRQPQGNARGRRPDRGNRPDGNATDQGDGRQGDRRAAGRANHDGHADSSQGTRQSPSGYDRPEDEGFDAFGGSRGNMGGQVPHGMGDTSRQRDMRDEGAPRSKPAVAIGFVIYFVIMGILCVILFFGGHELTKGTMAGGTQNGNGGIIGGIMSSLTGGFDSSLGLDDIFGKNKAANTSPSANTPQENGNAADANTGNAYIRTDFDPEDAVQDMDMAPDDKKDVATGFFTAIRQAFTDKDEQSLISLVDLDAVTKQIAQAYANLEKTRLGLTDGETSDLAASYQDMLKKRELSHVDDGDVYASIFGGRVREVRMSSKDPTRMYVVMEALGGDHQRICFTLENISSDSTKEAWALTGVMDAEGYARQVLSGDTSGNVKK